METPENEDSKAAALITPHVTKAAHGFHKPRIECRR